MIIKRMILLVTLYVDGYEAGAQNSDLTDRNHVKRQGVAGEAGIRQ